MRKLKKWLVERFLPAWAKESVHRENQTLREEIADLKACIKEREAYIDGLERGLRAQRRITIRNEVSK